MPRDGSGIYHRPAGTDGVPNFPIESAKYNTYVADIETDLNTPRPIVAGGTGASTAAGAITNLGGEQSHQLVTNYDSMAWVSGSFYSAAGATSAPTANAFSGIVYVTDANNIVVEARDAATKGLYIRAMTAGTWSPWKLDNDLYFLDTAPPGAPDGSMWWETDSGILFVRYNDGSSTQWVPATPQQDLTTRVAKAGDTMTGFLTLVGDPIAPLNAATKQYVDSGISAGIASIPPTPMRGWIAGLTLSTGGSSTFAVAAGEAVDTTNTSLIKLASSIFKTTSAWAVGTGVGALDTGSIAASAWYYVYLIKRPDTGVVDVIFSLNATSPSLPASYTLFRRIGSLFTTSSLWLKFSQNGDEFLWDTTYPTLSAFSLTTASVNVPAATPTGIVTNALMHFTAANNVGNGVGYLVYSPGTVQVVSGGNAQLISQLSNTPVGCDVNIRTNAAGQVSLVASSTGNSVYLATYGWIDTRGRFA